MDLDDLIPLCDIISLHAPLMPSTFNMIHSQRISKMKDGGRAFVLKMRWACL